MILRVRTLVASQDYPALSLALSYPSRPFSPSSILPCIFSPEPVPPLSGAVTVSDEPEYLKALRKSRELRKPGAGAAEASTTGKNAPSPAEREATRWAREVGGRDVRLGPTLRGAKIAILVQPITPFGTPPVSLEGLPDREALAERVKAAQGAGENVLGIFELTTGRPLTVETVEGKVNIVPGKPRTIMKAESPERMIRKAAAEAALLAKTRKPDEGRGGGRGRR